MVEEVASRLQLYFGQSFLVFWTKPYFFGPRIQYFLYFGPHRPYGIGKVGWVAEWLLVAEEAAADRSCHLPPASWLLSQPKCDPCAPCVFVFLYLYSRVRAFV